MPDLSENTDVSISRPSIIFVPGFLLSINTPLLNCSRCPEKHVHSCFTSEELKYSETHKKEPERTEIATHYSVLWIPNPFRTPALKSHEKTTAKPGPELTSPESHRIRQLLNTAEVQLPGLGLTGFHLTFLSSSSTCISKSSKPFTFPNASTVANTTDSHWCQPPA